MMNVLFLETNESIREELRECLSDIDGIPYFARTIEKAVATLHTHPIDIVVLEVRQITDVELLRHVHQYFQNVRIILTLEKDIKDAISTVRNSQFKVLRKPFTLRDLRSCILRETETGEHEPGQHGRQKYNDIRT